MPVTRVVLLPQEVEASTLRVFNILAEPASVVANWLVPRLRAVSQVPVQRGSERSRATYVRFLTGTSAVMRFLTSPLWSSNRYIDTATGKLRVEEHGCPTSITVVAKTKSV
jgi:hypothetical protein